MVDRDQLERGFRPLKPEQRVVVVFNFYDGLPVPEIAETLGIRPARSSPDSTTHCDAAPALEADARETVAPNGQQHDPGSIARRTD